MTNTALLQEKLSESGYKLRFIAKQIGISYQAFLNKINNKSEFKASEIKSLQDLLNFTDEIRDEIFFFLLMLTKCQQKKARKRKMANDLQIFNNPEFGQVRTVTIDGDPWFVGKDVAGALGYDDTVNALKKHVDPEDKIMRCQNATPSIKDSMGRIQYPTWINESGLYSLIFGSKLESARRFKHWVTSEVLPALRKTGSYEMPRTNRKTYPPKASGLSEVGNFMRMVREVMERQGCTATEVAIVMKEMCLQFGIQLPEMFVKARMGFADFAAVYHQETGKKASYQDYEAYKSVFTRKARKR